jgi:hypothetical protein
VHGFSRASTAFTTIASRTNEKGHFSRASTAFTTFASRTNEKGHDFSRAATGSKNDLGL